MNIITIILIAIGLSIDSFAVSTASGCILQSVNFFKRVKVALVLALFQGSMPILGWYIGNIFSEKIVKYDHWIAFTLLLLIGLKMIYEGFKDEHNPKLDILKPISLIILGIATSIDALVVGLSMSLIGQSIWLPAIIIGIVTFIFSYGGIYFGYIISKKLKFKVEYIGGIILILLGFKILIEHSLLQ